MASEQGESGIFYDAAMRTATEEEDMLWEQEKKFSKSKWSDSIYSFIQSYLFSIHCHDGVVNPVEGFKE